MTLHLSILYLDMNQKFFYVFYVRFTKELLYLWINKTKRV